MRATLVVLLLTGCVEESLVIGDDRARLACEEAVTLFTPPSGCTTIAVDSVSPYGCLEDGIFGGSGRDHAGSWVRLSNASGATLRVRVTANAVLCSSDGGAATCDTIATVRDFGGTPCTCAAGSVTSHALTTSVTEIELGAPTSEVLLEPLGASFEVSLCANGPIGP